MRRIRDLQRTRLLDSFDGLISPLARKRLIEDWQGTVRAAVLFADFFGWTTQEAADNYFDKAPSILRSQNRQISDG